MQAEQISNDKQVFGQWLQIAVIGLTLWSAYLMFRLHSLNTELREFYCDLNVGIQAERRFTYPILRRYGDPDAKAYYPDGTEVTNPITSNPRYAKNCNHQ